MKYKIQGYSAFCGKNALRFIGRKNVKHTKPKIHDKLYVTWKITSF